MSRFVVATLAAVVLCSWTFAGDRQAAIDAWAAEELAAGKSPETIFDSLIAYHPRLDRSDSLVAAFTAKRVDSWRRFLPEGDAFRAWLTPDRSVTAALAALSWNGIDNDAEVIKVVRALWSDHGDRIDRYPELAAAFAVVYDAGPAWRMIEFSVENRATPGEMFEHLTGGGSSMTFDPASLPGDLLRYVVDAPVSVDDLAWSIEYAPRDRVVGKQFHRIEYDDEALRLGDGVMSLRGEVDRRGSFSVPMVLDFGGVCRHQAFFAASVGKAIGVPTVYSVADGPDTAHAWVGYLRGSASRPVWDFSEGRFGFYERVRGEVRCPQTQAEVGDQRIAMTAELASVPVGTRIRATALAAAAVRLGTVETTGAAWPPSMPELDERRGSRTLRRRGLPREAAAETRFDVLEMSVETSPWSGHGWMVMKAWAGDMDDAARQRWFEVLDGVVGRKYPDVLVEMLSPIIRGVPDPGARDRAWLWLGERVERHDQLAVEVAVDRGAGMSDAGELDAAWRWYVETVSTYANAGPIVIEALDALRALAGEDTAALTAAAEVFAEVYSDIRPSRADYAPQYRRWSTKSRVGRMYADLLRDLGRADEAQRISEESGA